MPISTNGVELSSADCIDKGGRREVVRSDSCSLAPICKNFYDGGEEMPAPADFGRSLSGSGVWRPTSKKRTIYFVLRLLLLLLFSSPPSEATPLFSCLDSCLDS